MANDGRLVINAPIAASIFDAGNGYTVVGFNTIPEPGTCWMVTIMGIALIRRR